MNSVPSAFGYLDNGGETGKLILQKLANSLPELSQTFHTSLNIVLHSPLPMFMLWGDDKLFYYNDAFKPIVDFQNKHPEALGNDLRTSWSFFWEKMYSSKSALSLPVKENKLLKEKFWQIHLTEINNNEVTVGVLHEFADADTNTTKLIDLENKLNDVVRQSPISTSIFRGPDFVIEKANRQALELWGRDESIIGKTIAEVFPELADQPYMQLLHDVYNNGLQYEGKENLAHLVRNGRTESLYVTFIYKPLHDHTGKIDGILCMGYDVTEHVEVREKLIAGEERNRLALEAGRLGTFDVDLKADTFVASERFYEIFGVDPSTTSRQTLVDVIHPDDMKLREEAHKKALITGELVFDARTIMQDGTIKWFSTNARYIRDENNNPVRLVGVLQDITSVKTHNELIAKAEHKFKETVQNAPVGISIFTGKDYVCEMANDSYLKLIDQTAEEFIGKRIADSLPEVMPEVGPLFDRIFENGETIEATEFEVTLNRHGRLEQAFFNFVYQPIKNNDDAITGILVIASEVTQQVKTKHEIIERERNFSNMVMQSPIAMTIFRGADYVIEVANDILVNTIWRKKREEVIGKKVLEVFPELNDQKYPELLNKVYTKGIVHSEKESPAYVQGNDGLRLFYLDFEYSPLKDKDGSINAIMITVSDVTERVEARKKVEDAEARMRIAVEGTGTATWDLDLKTKELIHSPKLAEIFGHPLHTKLKHNDTYAQVLEEDRLNILEPALKEAFKTGNYSYEGRVYYPDKSIHWIRTNGKVVFDEDGKPSRMLGTMTDITGRKEDEKRLLQLAAIVESTDDAIISKTIEGIVTSFNHAAEKLFGYHAEEIIGRPISVLFPEGYENEEPRILARLKLGEKVDHFETVRRHKSGKLIDVSLTISPLKDSEGNVIGASKIARDITEQKQIEKHIKETQDQLQIVIEASELGTWELNVQNGEVNVSDRYLEITGGKFFDNPTHEQLKTLLHPDDLPIREKGFTDAFATGRLYYETRLVWPDNTIHWVEARGKLFYDEKNKPLKLVGTIRDLTEERTYQQTISISEQRFRTVADTAPVMIWMVDQNMKYTFLNNLWLEFTGLTIEEENDGEFTKGLYPDDYERVVPAYVEAFKKREPFYFEYRLRRFDNEYRWISDTGTPQFSADGTFEGYIGACMDINDRIVFEQKLRESENRLRIAAVSGELGTWTYEPLTDQLIWDSSTRGLFGVDDYTPVNLDLFLAKLHPDDRESTRLKMERSMNPEIADIFDVEYRVIGLTHDNIRWIHAKGKAQFNDDNIAYLFAGTVLDTTEKRLALEELQENEQKFRLLADSMPQLIWTGDEDGNLIYFNKSVYDYSGLTPQQTANGGWIKIVHPDDRERNISAWNKSVSTGKPFLFEHRFKRNDGEYRWQLSRAVPQRDAYGNIQQWVGTSTDIHEQKTFVEELEYQVKLRTRELNKANEDLTKSNDELAQFAYVASHDLQEPLRKIQTFSNRIIESEGEKFSSRGQDYFNRIQATSQRMQQLIIDLLSFSRTNTAEKHFEKADLNVIVSTVQEQLRESISAKKAKITSDKLPVADVIVFQFEQLLTNIISNAIKFSKPGEAPDINISCRLASAAEIEEQHLDPSQQYHHISISDNGIGFSDEYKDRIFQVFQRLHGRDKYEGTGIGLAIVKKIIENHRGAISAHGIENEGAVFHIYIPVENNQAV